MTLASEVGRGGALAASVLITADIILGYVLYCL